MTGVHRSPSPASRRPMARILAALCAGSAVMFAAAVVQGGALFVGEDEIVAGPQSDGIVDRSSPETAVTPQDGALRAAGDDARPVIVWQSDEAGTGPSPARDITRPMLATAATTADQPAQWPDTPPEWDESLREALVQQAPAPAEPPPTTAAQPPPAADDVDQSEDGVIVNVLGSIGAGS